MSQRADPLTFLWQEMEEAMGSDAVGSVSDQGVYTGPILISKAADDAHPRP